MKNRRHSLARQIAWSGSLVLVFAGCQLSVPSKPTAGTEGTIGTASQNGAKPGNATNGQKEPIPAVDAKITGLVTDTAGAPVANLRVYSDYGRTVTTDAAGRYTLDVTGLPDVRLDFSGEDYISRQELVGVQAGETAEMNVVLKPIDKNVVTMTPDKGGRVVSSDGNAIVEIPPGALTGETKIRTTWLNPMPTKDFPNWGGELPGRLMSTSDDPENAGKVAMPPFAFATVTYDGGRLAANATATLKMKASAETLQFLKDSQAWDPANPNFNQQPCFEFDRVTGLWVNPSTSKIEQDDKGDYWLVYTMHGAEMPKNYKTLQVIGTGSQTDTKNFNNGRNWEDLGHYAYSSYTIPNGGTVSYSYWVPNWQWVNKYCTTFSGQAFEKSSNPALNGKGLPGASVTHNPDFYGSDGTTGDANGRFTLTGWYNNRNPIRIWSVARYYAAYVGNNYNATVNTDSYLSGKIDGARAGETMSYTIDGKAATAAATGFNFTFGRETGAYVNDFVITGVKGQGIYTGDKGPYLFTRDFKMDSKNDYPSWGTDRGVLGDQGPLQTPTCGLNPGQTGEVSGAYSVRDFIGQVIERVTPNPDNAQTPHQADKSGLKDTTITHPDDFVLKRTKHDTDKGGNLKFTLLSKEAAPAISADYKGFVQGKATAAPYMIELNTDSKLTLEMKGMFIAVNAGDVATVKYKVDDIAYEKKVTLPADGKFTLTFCRDMTDDKLNFELVSIDTPHMKAETFPKTSLTPNGSKTEPVILGYKTEAVKYRAN